MNRRVDGSTAILAAAFGGMLIAADGLSRENVVLDAKTAKELAIISRVLEKRLSDARASLNATAPATALEGPAATREGSCGDAGSP